MSFKTWKIALTLKFWWLIFLLSYRSRTRSRSNSSSRSRSRSRGRSTSRSRSRSRSHSPKSRNRSRSRSRSASASPVRPKEAPPRAESASPPPPATTPPTVPFPICWQSSLASTALCVDWEIRLWSTRQEADEVSNIVPSFVSLGPVSAGTASLHAKSFTAQALLLVYRHLTGESH